MTSDVIFYTKNLLLRIMYHVTRHFITRHLNIIHKKISTMNIENVSLPEVHRTIAVPQGANFWRKLMAFAGPGLLVSVGYMDPGNWATDIAGGAQFGYTLLSVVLMSNFFAMILQHLALRLGIATGYDLAQACKAYYSRPASFVLWILCELAIAACDLAEVIGSAIALNLLFGIPLSVGVVITVLDVLVILFFQNRGFRFIEILVATLVFTIFCCFFYEIVLAQPEIAPLMKGLVPSTAIFKNNAMLLVAIGILGATVMPHNLYLHSSIVQTRAFEKTTEGKREAIKFATIDSTLSLFLAFFVNAAILVMAAAVFHSKGRSDVGDIFLAHELLSPALGAKAASVVFAVALLASGQSSTLTGTLAGQIVMEGFLNIRLAAWARRLITRAIAIVPALIVTWFYGEGATGKLLIISQVILSMQLSFAVFPLVMFTASSEKMGEFVNPRWLSIIAAVIAVVICGLNVYMLVGLLF
jgi:manganese transport protein